MIRPLPTSHVDGVSFLPMLYGAGVRDTKTGNEYIVHEVSMTLTSKYRGVLFNYTLKAHPKHSSGELIIPMSMAHRYEVTSLLA